MLSPSLLISLHVVSEGSWWMCWPQFTIAAEPFDPHLLISRRTAADGLNMFVFERHSETQSVPRTSQGADSSCPCNTCADKERWTARKTKLYQTVVDPITPGCWLLVPAAHEELGSRKIRSRPNGSKRPVCIPITIAHTPEYSP